MQLDSSFLYALLACGVTQVAAKDRNLRFLYGPNAVRDDFDKWEGDVQLYVGDKPFESGDISDKKSNLYGIKQMNSICEITTKCVDGDDGRTIHYDDTIPHHKGIYNWEKDICPNDGTIKSFKADCDGKRILDVIAPAVSEGVARVTEDKRAVPTTA